MLVVCSSVSDTDSCAKANAFASSADNSGVDITVSPQALSSADINSKLGVSASYSNTVADYINSVL